MRMTYETNLSWINNIVCLKWEWLRYSIFTFAWQMKAFGSLKAIQTFAFEWNWPNICAFLIKYVFSRSYIIILAIFEKNQIHLENAVYFVTTLTIGERNLANRTIRVTFSDRPIMRYAHNSHDRIVAALRILKTCLRKTFKQIMRRHLLSLPLWVCVPQRVKMHKTKRETVPISF